MRNYYVVRMEVTNDKEVTCAWQDWGGSSRKSDAIKEAKQLLKEIKEGKWDRRLSDKERAEGFYLNACVEVVNDDGDLLEILEVA